MPTVKRRKNGSLSIRLPHAEGLVLCTLPRRLRDLLENESFHRRIVDRLFPRAYADDDEETEYRQLIGNDLRDRKLASMALFEKTLERLRMRSWGVELSVHAEEVDPWLGFVNDIRLFLGIELDIQDNDWGQELDPEDETVGEEAVLLHFLTWLQQEILDALGFSNPTDVHPDLAPEDDDDGPIV
jgi:hypothetical protein